MNDEEWKQIDSLLMQALDLDPAGREEFLLKHCSEPSVRERVQQLLTAAELETNDLMTGGGMAGGLADELSTELEGFPVPDTIPGYTLGPPIGSGGMGHVWEAVQEEPIRRQVAVKVIRPERASSNVIARFESERRTLAMMNHPAIAQVYDAGVTDSGRPFLSMEYVDGIPLTEFCDKHRLSLPGRLQLFAVVCDAVQHAHQRGVIHRDLKPSNVLVTDVDGRATPKVIDFGIARLAEDASIERTLLTEEGMIVGTPEYMSPEQAGTDLGDVDTRSDVYALGVLLFELLTGTLPFRRKDSTPAALMELFRDVRSTEPALPSDSVAASGNTADEAAEARSTDLWGLTRTLRRDLDWITTRAMEKDRSRRYASVGGLAADIRSYLRHEPVVAGPPGSVYRAQKFIRRHRGFLAAAAAVLVVLVAGLIGTGTGLVRARRETEHARTQAAIAEAVNEFVNKDLLSAVSPGSQGRDVGMSEVLDAAAERLEGRFPDQPEVEASVRFTIGQTYLALGRLDDASPHLERAVVLREEALGADHIEALNATQVLGELRFYQGRAADAEQLLARTLVGRERALGPDDPQTLGTLSDLGAVSHLLGRLEDAERHYREAYARATRSVGDDDPFVQAMLHNLGALLRDLGQFKESESFLRRALEGTRRDLGDEHPETLSTLSLLGSVMREDKRSAEAEPIYHQVYEARQRVLGPDHASTLLSANNLALLLADLGDVEGAVEMLEDTVATQRRVLGADHDDTILCGSNLAALLLQVDRVHDAEVILTDAMERCARTLGADHSLCNTTLRKHGQCLTALGRYEEAESALLSAHQGLLAVFSEGHRDVLVTESALADLYDKWGRPADATQWRER